MNKKVITVLDDGKTIELTETGDRFFIRHSDVEQFMQLSKDTIGKFLLEKAQEYDVTDRTGRTR